MEYPISQISNRDLQVLYKYRILKQPSDLLKVTYTDSEPVELEFDAGSPTSEKDSYGRTVYRFIAPVEIKQGWVPLLEFRGNDSDWADLADLIKASFQDNQVILYSGSSTLGSTLEVHLYWCTSLQEIENALESLRAGIQDLEKDIENLNSRLSSLSFGGDYMERPSGSDEHLVKYALGSDKRITLSDSEHIIITGALPKQRIVNPDSETLRRLNQVIGDTVTIDITDGRPRYFSDFTGAALKLNSNGDLYLENIHSEVILNKFGGDLYTQNCACIHLSDDTKIRHLYAINTIIEMSAGRIQEVTLTRNSVLNHRSGIVKAVAHIGFHCTYYSEVPESSIRMAGPSKIPWERIQGVYCDHAGHVIRHGKEISFFAGHHDDPLPVVATTTVTGSTYTTETVKAADGGMVCPESRDDNWSNTEEWRTFTLSAKFMEADRPPSTVEEAKQAKYNGLMGCAYWCAHEYGLGSASMVMAKLIRIMAMYPFLSEGVAGGFTMTRLYDIRLIDSSGIIGGAGTLGPALSSPCWDNLKSWLQTPPAGTPESPTDAQILLYTQYVYNNIRYGNLYGMEGIFRKWSSPVLIDALAYMPTNNYVAEDYGWSWTIQHQGHDFYLNEISGLTATGGLTFVAGSITRVRDPSIAVLNENVK